MAQREITDERVFFVSENADGEHRGGCADLESPTRRCSSSALQCCAPLVPPREKKKTMPRSGQAERPQAPRRAGGPGKVRSSRACALHRNDRRAAARYGRPRERKVGGAAEEMRRGGAQTAHEPGHRATAGTHMTHEHKVIITRNIGCIARQKKICTVGQKPVAGNNHNIYIYIHMIIIIVYTHISYHDNI